MASRGEKFKWDRPFGPYKEVIEQIFAALNSIQPLEGIGTAIDQTDHGRQISSTAQSGGKAAAAGAQSDPDITFYLSDATVTEGDPPEVSNKVFVADGKINGEFPDGMGSSEYILDLATPEDSLIYAGITFDPDTLEITSRFLGVATSGDYPESRIDEEDGGCLYWLLGFTFFDSDDKFRVVMTRVGDINFQLVYGALNGAPALLPVDSTPGWIALP